MIIVFYNNYTIEMRNYRKTLKKGGFNFEKVYTCPRTKTGKKSAESTCYKAFADKNNFKIVITADDGNCFYDTLSKFGQRTLVPLLNKPHIDIRKFVVEELLENSEEVAPYFVNNNGNVLSSEEVKTEIKKLARPNVWNSNGGDIVIQYAAKALGVNIHIYDVHEQHPDNVINKLSFDSPVESDVTVSMLRIHNSHYMLLWPENHNAAAGILNTAPKGKKISATVTAKVAPASTTNRPRRQTRKPNKYTSNNSNKRSVVSNNLNSGLANALRNIELYESSVNIPK
jgi:hypothetical protein